jgi:hypothetical protein
MKRISIVGLLILLGACSTHAGKCRGPLRPINEPAVGASKPATGSQPATNPHSADSQKRDGSADLFRSVPQP